jgi:hypothetical protein
MIRNVERFVRIFRNVERCGIVHYDRLEMLIDWVVVVRNVKRFVHMVRSVERFVHMARNVEIFGRMVRNVERFGRMVRKVERFGRMVRNRNVERFCHMHCKC